MRNCAFADIYSSLNDLPTDFAESLEWMGLRVPGFLIGLLISW